MANQDSAVWASWIHFNFFQHHFAVGLQNVDLDIINEHFIVRIDYSAEKDPLVFDNSAFYI